MSIATDSPSIEFAAKNANEANGQTSNATEQQNWKWFLFCSEPKDTSSSVHAYEISSFSYHKSSETFRFVQSYFRIKFVFIWSTSHNIDGHLYQSFVSELLVHLCSLISCDATIPSAHCFASTTFNRAILSILSYLVLVPHLAKRKRKVPCSFLHNRARLTMFGIFSVRRLVARAPNIWHDGLKYYTTIKIQQPNDVYELYVCCVRCFSWEADQRDARHLQTIRRCAT